MPNAQIADGLTALRNAREDVENPLSTNPSDDTTRPSRPAGADRRAARRNADVQRYTVDLGREQRLSLSLWAAQWEVDKSKIVRTLLYLLEADPALRARVQAEIFTDSHEGDDAE